MRQAPIRTLATALVFASAGTSAMAMSSLAGASVTLGGLNLQLIDLDLNDGVTPSLTLTAPITLNFLDHANSDSQTLVEDSYNWDTANRSSTTGMSSFNTAPNGFKASAQIAPSDLLLTTLGPYVNSVDDGTGNVGRSTTIVDSSANSSVNLNARNLGQEDFNANTNQWEQRFAGTLSANTALIITGTTTLSLTLDRASLSGVRLDDTGGDVEQTLNGSALASASFKLIGGDISKLGSGYNNGLGGDVFQSSFETSDSIEYLQTEDVALGRGGVLLTEGLINRELIQNFSLVAFNTTGNATDIGMAVDVYAGASWRNSVATSTQVNLPSTPGVPEPSTYALMGLGLVGIALASRRQRPTQEA
jgi:PEP-CTERM motif